MVKSMKRVVSVSGGKSSAYILANYPNDYAVFSLVRTDDKNCLYPDKKIRQIVSDKIGKEFIGTLEQDAVIKIVLELEQFTGKKIDWISGETFDELIKKKKMLPNVMMRFCTQNLKMYPVMKWWKNNINEVIEMAIGFRANETRRANRIADKCDKNGIESDKFIVGKKGNRNKWGLLKWRKPTFPLIKNNIYSDTIYEFWKKNKQVPFIKGYYNNCVGCFHRNPLFLKKMSEEHKNKMQWFAEQENKTRQFKKEIAYKDIVKWKLQQELSFDDFSECDSGYCGV
jgi:hypothetical protein